MSGIKPLIILTVASFYLAIMPWGKRAYQFVPYAMLPKANLKNGRLIRTAIGTESLRKFLPIVGLYTLNRAWESPDQMLKEQGRGIGTVFLKRFHKTPSGVFINDSVLIETLPLCSVHKACRGHELYINLDALPRISHLLIRLGDIFRVLGFHCHHALPAQEPV